MIILALLFNLSLSAQPTGVLLPYQGETKPPIVLPDISGKNHSLSHYRGKIILLNFWASWCAPCIHEMPSMEKLKSKVKKTIPFEIIAVNQGEEKETVKKFLKTKKHSFVFLLDPASDTSEKYGVDGLPASYIIDSRGKIRYAVYGGFDWNKKEVLEAIKKLAAEDPDCKILGKSNKQKKEEKPCP